ncbi:antimicrobial peptide NK-lysin-like [Seriola dumerili]|uniref:Antimicrobial peptide NK-lysin-like n=1 Tax=Seriola dumerili TaxID=41447 RepID=A0A3B4V1J9_SERDU|nr:antimicrobial peptide NK-lysin-like [Seriola dumerili]
MLAMETSSVLLVCILVTCSVWTVRGRSFVGNIDDQVEQLEVEGSTEAGMVPGVCWVCEWALNKVKKDIGPNTTSENVKLKLVKVCDEIYTLKTVCHNFVKKHLKQLIEELMTSDDVRTICVNTKACKPKELSHLIFYPGDEDSQAKM